MPIRKFGFPILSFAIGFVFVALTLVGVLYAADAAPAAGAAGTLGLDWPQLRGPQRNGVTTESGWLDKWPANGPPQLWKLNVGIGASSVSVCQDRLYTMGNAKGEDTVYCLNPDTGKELWRFSYPCPFEERQYDGGTASTPTTDGQHVYVLSHKGYLVCLDAATGTKVWDKDLPKDFAGKPGGWGYACSPLIEGNMLIIDNGGDGTANLALDKTNGQLIWKSGDGEASYSCAAALTVESKRRIIMVRSNGVSGLDAATGKELWLIPWPSEYKIIAATPVIDGHLVFISSGYTPGTGGVIDVGSDAAKLLWQNKNLKNHVASSVIWQGHIYGINGQLGARNAQLKCLDLMTGQEKWKQTGFGTGALTLADGKLIVQGETGEVAIIEASPQGFKALSQFRLFSEGHSWVDPVLSHGRLYCKTNQGDLYCLDVRPK